MIASPPSDSFSVAIAGVAGRMGRQLAAVGHRRGLTIAGGTEVAGSPHLDMDIGDLAGIPHLGVKPQSDPVAAAASADVWLDFTRPAATLAALEALKHTRVRAAIIGTTGFSPAEEKQVERAAAGLVIVKSGSFALGIKLLETLIRRAAASLGPDWDIEVLESHHNKKVDAPSGTALMLGEAAAEGRGSTLEALRAGPYDGPDAARKPGTIGFSVRRMGGVIGEHEVSFASDTEIVTISHTSLDRAMFAEGALKAAAWALKQSPGLYSMDDVLGLSGN
ncbi:MAG TPA: 4-hydroxy-tetrahydrodipicolinate reductase [Hyphomonas sp.]|nr:4-hydroxy-tetrahydrodipicolinate reductase [Hyphomonas sp.]HRX73332.1 4-hydroxy-tetrahydrodipicolinate reductase [Hyphomonas sp.]